MGYAVLLIPAIANQLATELSQAPVVITVAAQGAATLDPADIAAVTQAMPSAAISRTLAPGPTLVTDTAPAIDVESVDAAFFGIYALKPTSGTLFTPTDDLRANRVAVVGQQAAQTLFGSPSTAIGKSIRVRNVSLTVIGVLAQPSDPDLAALGRSVFVPLQTGRVRLVGNQASTELVIGVTNASDASNLAALASRVLALRHPGAASLFSVQRHVEGQAPPSIPELLTRAAVEVRAEFLTAKDLSLVSQASPAVLQ